MLIDDVEINNSARFKQDYHHYSLFYSILVFSLKCVFIIIFLQLAG